jgi:hypothetical protein
MQFGKLGSHVSDELIASINRTERRKVKAVGFVPPKIKPIYQITLRHSPQDRILMLNAPIN